MRYGACARRYAAEVVLEEDLVRHQTPRKRDFSVRSRANIAKSEIRRERYERFLRGSVAQQPVEKRIAESRAKREAAQRIGTNKSK